MANPQPIPFAPISLELLEAIIRYPFTARQLKVMLSIAIANYGPKQKTKAVEMTVSQLADRTGIDESHVRKAIAELLKIDAIEKKDLGKKRFELGIQKNYDRWTSGPKRPETFRPNQPGTSGPNRPDFRTKSARKSAPTPYKDLTEAELRTESLSSIDPRNGTARDFNECRIAAAEELKKKYGKEAFDTALAACPTRVIYPIAWVKKRLEARASQTPPKPNDDRHQERARRTREARERRQRRKQQKANHNG